MKIPNVIVVLLILSVSYLSFINMNDDSNKIANNKDNELDGKTFTGTATEITPPDVDRMPIVYNETIFFQDGKLICESFKKYACSETESDYSSFIDGRRAVAYTVVTFKSSTTGIINGETVDLEFSGNVFAYKNLNGDFILKYPDGKELKFFIEAQIN